MRAVLTRVKSASVTISGRVTGQIGQGYLILLGVAPGDTEREAARLAEKIANLRIFNDENGKMNLNLATVGGSILVISQFTLFADVRSRRPSFSGAARPEAAVPLYELFLSELGKKGFHVEHGEFGAEMLVESVNDGPVTLLFDTDQL